MTDFTKPHGPQGPTIEAADKRPWKAPRLIDLDDDNAMGCMGAPKAFPGVVEFLTRGPNMCVTYSSSAAGDPVS